MTTYSAHLLAPKKAEAYIYDDHLIVGEISAESGSFIWNGETIDTTRTPVWVMVVIKGDSARQAHFRLDYQADRIRSGMYPVHVSEVKAS